LAARPKSLVTYVGPIRGALTIFTVVEVRRLLSVWKDSGEAGHGSR
jgi:hypothetical protein